MDGFLSICHLGKAFYFRPSKKKDGRNIYYPFSSHFCKIDSFLPSSKKDQVFASCRKDFEAKSMKGFSSFFFPKLKLLPTYPPLKNVYFLFVDYQKGKKMGHFKNHLGSLRMKNPTPKGIRIPVTSVKGRCPRPLDDGGIFNIGIC